MPYIMTVMGLTIAIPLVTLLLLLIVTAESRSTLSKAPFILAGVLVWIFAVGVSSFAFSIHQVEAGHVGVVYSFGEITGQTGEGLVWTAPWADVRNADTRVQKHTFEDIAAASFETQDVRFRVTLNYRVSPIAVQSLYRNVGVNYFDVLVPSRLDQILKDETVQFTAIEVTQKRDEIREAVASRLAAELGAYSVEVVSLQIDNIDYSAAFNESIEQKQVATQDALREQERVKQAQYEAQQSVERAKGEAEANNILSASITPQLLQRQAIEALADNISVVLIPTGEGLIIDPSSILRTATE